MKRKLIQRAINNVSSQTKYKPKSVDFPQRYKSPYPFFERKKGTDDQNERIDAVFKSIGNSLGFKIKTEYERGKVELNKMRTQLVREAVKKTTCQIGESSCTKTILVAAMTSLVIKALESGTNPNMIKKGIKLGVDHALKYLNDISIPIVEPYEMDQISKLATNGDIPLAELATDAFIEVGRDGWIEVEESKTGFDYLEKIKGIKINNGFVSSEFINEEKRVFYPEIYLLLSEDVLSTQKCVLPSIQAATKERYPLLIIAKDFVGEALQTLIRCRSKDKMRICAVKAPNLDEYGKRLLLDLAISCETTIFSDKTLRMIEEIRPKQHFGLAWSADINEERTIIANKPSVRRNNNLIRRNIRELKSKIIIEENEEEKDQLRKRLSRFVQRIAIIKVGGKSQEEIKRRCCLAKKAVASLRAALEHGAVPGGGSALVKSLRSPQIININNDLQIGFDLVRKALWVPCMVVVKNAGLNPSELAYKLWTLKREQGFDMRTKKIVDMYKEGIMDPTKVLTSGLEFAEEVALDLIDEYLKSKENNKN